MMSSEESAPVVPDKLRPGELGVITIGRVIMGDIAVTAVDLCVRDLLAVEEIPVADGRGDWLLRPRLASATQQRRTSLLGYEETLLEGLARQGEAFLLSSLSRQAAHLLDATRSAIVRDAVHHGWLRHLDHEKRTDEGDELAHKIWAFQGQLKDFISERGKQAVPAELLPYALHFGYVLREDSPLTRFAHAWVDAFADLPGWRTRDPQRSGFDDDPMLTLDDRMRQAVANEAFFLGTVMPL
jgi:hypothetical protein